MGIRISEMEEATTFGADDYVPIVTNGTNKKALGQKIKDFIAGFFATKTGDNISDKEAFRSAIEISATNTPFDKTGTGMTAENVQAGIAELSSNKANISGDNIANPSAFRTAINAQEVITPELITTWTPNTTYVISSQFIKVFKFWKMVVISFGAEIKASAVNAILLQDLPTAIRAGGNANYFGTITGANGVSSRMRIDGSNMIVDSAIATQQWYSGLFVYFIA